MTGQDVVRFLRYAKMERAAFVRKFRRVTGQKMKIRCRGKGCDACCYQLVMAHAWEGALIARHLIETQQDALLDRVIEQGFQIVGRYFQGGQVTPGSNSLACYEWYIERNPCLFLQNGECLIYGLRPVACSSYLVGSDPELCSAGPDVAVSMADCKDVFGWAANVERKLIAKLTGRGEDDRFFVSAVPLGYAIAAGLFLLRGESPPLSTNEALSA